MDVEFHPEAELEVEHEVAWYLGADAADASLAFLDELRLARSRIGAHPLRYPGYLFGTRRYVLENFPHSVVYRVLPEHVLVLAVAPDRKRPGYWRRRK